MTNSEMPHANGVSAVYRAASWLAAASAVYLAAWCALALAVFMSGFELTLFGLDMRAGIQASPSIAVAGLFAETLVAIITYLLIRARRFAALWTCLLAIGLQLMIWISLAANPHFGGRIGFALFVTHTILAILIVLARMDDEVR